MDLAIGKTIHWHKTQSNYDHIDLIKGVVRKIGEKRITIEVPLKDGGTRLVIVRRENLREPHIEGSCR